jgi:small subunit ribosomal protein S1
LSMKQLVPSGLDEYVAEHKEGDVVSGRIVEVSGEHARVELGEGIQCNCRLHAAGPASAKSAQAVESSSAAHHAKPDLSSLGSMLQAHWKGGTPAGSVEQDPVRAGQIRKFRIAKLDAAAKKIELELA